jgi:peptidyl-prolyl cis-trans isomerase C
MKAILAAHAALVLLCGALAPAHAQGVKVNGKEIPASRIEALVKARIAQGQADTPELRTAVRDHVIAQELVAQEAVKKGLDKNAEVRAQLDFTRQEILATAYLREHFRNNPITDETLRKEYERLKAQQPAKEYRAHHILVEKEEEAKAVIVEIKKGVSFEKLAAEKSRDAGTQGRGGELDWSPAERYVKPFGEALARLKQGQITEAPVQTNYGWHVIRLDEERARKIPTFDEAKKQIQQLVQNQAVQKVVADLRAKAKVD